MALAFVTKGFRTFAHLWPAKRRAAAVHIFISLAIFLVLMYFVLFRWYPLPYFHSDGGWQGMRLMFAVDVVLGPLLTFIIFNPEKSRREIVLDLSFIALVQAAALAWGIYVVQKERPGAIIYWDGTFTGVPAHFYPEEDLGKLPEFDGRTPPVIHQRLPEGDEFMKSFRMTQRDGIPRSAQIFLYAPIKDSLSEIFLRAADFESKAAADRPELKAAFARQREKYGQDVGFLPFKGRYGEAIFVLSRSGEILDSLPRE